MSAGRWRALALHPFEGAAKSYGSHSTTADFETSVLKEPLFEEHVLRPTHVQAIANRLGALADGEVYIPQPYPFLGGTDAPSIYGKGNVWVFTHIVAQMGGL